MKTPRPIKAIAIVNINNPTIDIFEIYKKHDEISCEKWEKKCEVEIIFKKYL